jgi:hypothetical protein
LGEDLAGSPARGTAEAERPLHESLVNSLSGDLKRIWQVAVCSKLGKTEDERVKQFFDSVKIKQ